MPLPRRFHRYFWDADKAVLDTKQHPHYIIERLLERGNDEVLRWMLKTFSTEQIIQAIRSSTVLSRLSGNFWSRYFRLDDEHLPWMDNPPPRRLSTQEWLREIHDEAKLLEAALMESAVIQKQARQNRI